MKSDKSRAWCELVVTKNLFWKPLFRGNFDPFVNNANLGAIAHSEQEMGPKFPLFTKKNDLTLIKDFMARGLTLVNYQF